ncbi:MAG TPA: Gfo/Idh/MocA family oxidoreductase [Candidatus Brachybacterium intestinipullorum]|uniref:Gfo/Idh/MocA family oxidoreductase n=1 Tax=Candidatus Brachybacterium intestinipullorum TaxID=2838512 RepID=A0A9D2PZV3_9MICO|nr:Gfo/Idh/MocA family oxidoreductase [Candidatus Brachybacterium intestinipullorum]
MPESPARPLGIALIGYAFMGRAHSQAWRSVGAAFDVPEIERRVLVGRDESAVAQAARRLDWQEHATDWREVIAREDVDIVDICTPGFLHAEIAIAALEAGKHVLCEKPLANDTDEAVRMVEAARAARERGQVAALGHTYRRVPALAHARDLVAAGRLGEIRQVRASYLQDWLVDAEAGMSWRLRKETAGSGALGDIGSHAVDQIQFVTGQSVTAVRGRLATMVPERPGADGPEPVTVDDAAWASLELSGGAIASLEASRMATGRKNELSLEVYGTDGALRFDLERLDELWFLDATRPVTEQGFTRIVVTEPEHPYLEGWWPQGHVLGWENAFTNQARDLLLAVTDRDPAAYSPDFEDGLALQRILEAIIDSDAAGGSTVRL